jgi:hypothetical protein
MEHRFKKIEALKMRERGLPYSAIKQKIGVSKSTLSVWLRDMPLSKERINELRAKSPQRIERYRNTMKEKRDFRLAHVHKKAKQDIGRLTQREIFLAGLFLYWGEGGKTERYMISFANTDPDMVRFYIRWLVILKVPKERIAVRLQLYSDMSIKSEVNFWCKALGLPEENFRSPYIKKTLHKNVAQKGFGHGTCNIIVCGRDITDYVHEALSVLSKAAK